MLSKGDILISEIYLEWYAEILLSAFYTESTYFSGDLFTLLTFGIALLFSI